MSTTTANGKERVGWQLARAHTWPGCLTGAQVHQMLCYLLILIILVYCTAAAESITQLVGHHFEPWFEKPSAKTSAPLRLNSAGCGHIRFLTSNKTVEAWQSLQPSAAEPAYTMAVQHAHAGLQLALKAGCDSGAEPDGRLVLAPSSLDVQKWLRGAMAILGPLRARTDVSGLGIMPYLRRLLVAGMVALVSVCGSACDDAAHTQPANTLLLELHHMHAAASRRKVAMEYYHISKTGGTSLCLASADVGCKTFSRFSSSNCLVPAFNDGPRWIDRVAHDARIRQAGLPRSGDFVYKPLARYGSRYGTKGMSGLAASNCSLRAAFLAEKGWNFFASEYTVRGQSGSSASGREQTGPFASTDTASNSGDGVAVLPCAQFLNVLVVREPMARLKSHMRFVVKTYYEKMGQKTALMFDPAKQATTFTAWQQLLPAAFSNFYIRSLLGEEVFYMPASELGRRHLQRAMAMAATMDVLLVLEDSPERHNLTHLHGLAWDRVFISTTSRTSTADGPDQHDLTELLTKCLPSGQAEAKAMAEANALDVDLYDWVRFAARLDVLVWHAGQLAGLSPAPVSTSKSKRDPAAPCGYIQTPTQSVDV